MGDYQCGKTSFLNTLITGKGFQTTSIKDSTEVLERTLWRTSNNVEILFIEFGGHKAYETVLHHFIDKNALYIITYNHAKYCTEKHQEFIGQYLDFIRIHSPGAVVKIVGTKADDWRDIKRMPDIVLREVEKNVLDEIENEKNYYEKVLKDLYTSKRYI